MNETKKSRKRKEGILKRRAKADSKVVNKRYFIVTGKSISHLAPGVYEKVPGTKRFQCMLRISEKPEYTKKLDMEKTLGNVMALRGNKHFEKAFAHAMATAK